MKKLITSILVTFLLMGQVAYAEPIPTIPALAVETLRLSGLNRYETSAEICKNGWKATSDYAVLVVGENFPDALCAAPLARKYDAPILLTEKQQLTSDAKAELIRLSVKKVFIVGGTGVISLATENEVEALGIEVTRIAGNDRYETSVKVAENIGTDNGIVLATGGNFPDALSIAPIAASKQMPILLTNKDVLPDSVSSYVQGKTIPNTYIVGGTGVIANTVSQKFSNVKRLSGSDRYQTNVAIVEEFGKDTGFNTLYVATGEDFPDALSGSTLIAKNSSQILLVNKSVSSYTLDFINRHQSDINKVNILGGYGVVTKQTLITLRIMNKLGNTFDNINNAGIAARQGDWIYFRNYADNGTIYKVKVDGTQKTKVVGYSANSISVLNDRICFVAGSANGLGGSGAAYSTYLGSSYVSLLTTYTDSIFTTQDATYYGTGSGLYTDGSGFYASKRLTNEGGRNYVVDSGWIYYIRESAYDAKVYKVAISGGDPILVIDNNVNSFSVFNGEIYYINHSDHKLYKVDKDGNNATLVSQISMNKINIDSGWIYYINENDGYKLYRMTTKGTNNTKLTDWSVEVINVLEDWIIYTSSYEPYRIRIDGTLNQKM